jgi:hypothetical protein
MGDDTATAGGLAASGIAATFYAANTDDSAPSDRPSFTYGLR